VADAGALDLVRAVSACRSELWLDRMTRRRTPLGQAVNQIVGRAL
jgi:hypothetical protein